MRSNISMGNVMDLSSNSPFSISVWFRTTTATAPRPANSLDSGVYADLVSKEDINPPYIGWRFFMNDGAFGTVGIQLYSGLYQQLYTRTSSSTYNDGFWHLAVATYDGSGSNSGLRLYIDGSLASPTITAPQGALGPMSNPIDFNIGARDDAYETFDGDIDDVAVFSRGLTAAEISALYTGLWASAPIIPGPPLPPMNSAGQSQIGQSPSSTNKQGQVAEPVSTGSGNYFYSHTDFSAAGRGLPLLFERYYNSLDDFPGPLGTNWNHGYNISLSQTSGGVATIRWGDGHGETYALTGGFYVPQPGVYSSLVANTDGTFSLTQKNQMQYHFSSNGKLSFIQDKNGNIVQLSYDGSGNPVTVTASGGRTFSLAYDTTGRITTVSDPMGRLETFSYDGADNLATATDPLGGVTAYAYDANHRVTQITLPNGNTLLQNAYDAQGRVISQTNGGGAVWQFAYNTPSTGKTTITDPRGATTIHSYDASLRLVGIIDAFGHSVSYAYDSQNDRISVTNQNGNMSAFSYDTNGNLTGATDPLSNSTGFTYDGMNDLLTITNPKGKTTTLSYDSHGNLIGIQDPLSDKIGFTYDGYGEPVSRTDAKGNISQFSFSAAGDLTGITDALGNSTAIGYDGDGRSISITDPNHNTSTSAYDALGRLATVSDPLGHQTNFSYDAAGNLFSVTDANGHKTAYSYDAVSNLVSVTDALGHITTYSYDQDNNRVGFTNAKGNSTTYQYDALNRLTRLVDPLALATSYAYDALGNVIGVTDAKGQTNQFTYDPLNRLLSIAYADGKKVAYSYDPDGKRTTMVDPTGTTNYEYDDIDRLASVTFSGSKVVSYTYDQDSRRASLTNPDGSSIGFVYDADERLSNVTDWLSRVTGYAYDSAGNLNTVQYPNKVKIGFVYDAANRLTSVVNSTVGVPPLAISYSMDAAGNRTTITEGGIPTMYGYDADNRLTSAQLGPFVSTWSYDAVGNRVAQATPFGKTAYTYDASDRLLKAGTRTFTYDADGNQISVSDSFAHEQSLFTFDAANRLVGVSGSQQGLFTYDGDGNRIRQTIGNTVHTYTNDVAMRLPVVLQDAVGGITNSYVYGLGLIERAGATSSDFYQYDGLGSVIGLTDKLGRPEVAYLYDAWGAFLLPSPSSNPFLFTGQALDPGTGLYYLRARYYDPSTGRFMSPDQVPFAAQQPLRSNRYVYSISNPIRYVDPSGRSAEEESTQTSSWTPLALSFTLPNTTLNPQFAPQNTGGLAAPCSGLSDCADAALSLTGLFPTTELIGFAAGLGALGIDANQNPANHGELYYDLAGLIPSVGEAQSILDTTERFVLIAPPQPPDASTPSIAVPIGPIWIK